jgi:hypothetical protein
MMRSSCAGQPYFLSTCHLRVPRSAFGRSDTAARPSRLAVCASSNGRPIARVQGRNIIQMVDDAQRAYAVAEKPAWCQPTTIVLAGCAACAGSLALFHEGWLLTLAIIVNVAVFVWWYVFLILFPVAILERQDLEGQDVA